MIEMMKEMLSAMLLSMGLTLVPSIVFSNERSVDEAIQLSGNSQLLDSSAVAFSSSHPQVRWFLGASFDLFIHWDIYSAESLSSSRSIADNRFGGYPQCDIWKGSLSWSDSMEISAEPVYGDNQLVLNRLSDGYLMCLVTGLSGGLRGDFASGVSVFAEWLSPRREAFFEIDAFEQWPDYSEVPLTRKGDVVYIHLTGHEYFDTNVVTVRFDEQPVGASVLANGSVRVSYERVADSIRSTLDGMTRFEKVVGGVRFTLEGGKRDQLGEVIKVCF